VKIEQQNFQFLHTNAARSVVISRSNGAYR